MKIIIIGGHLAPALAVIERLPQDTKILYIGRKYALEGDKALSLEYQKITSLGINFASLSTGRLQRRFTRHTLASLLKLPIGFFQAFKILISYRPNIVVGFGGYVQIPVVLASYLLRIPIVLHEQTFKAGLANKIIAPFARVICISWSQSAKYFPKNKTILTGLPLRKQFFNKQNTTKKAGQKIIYITGGSLGAHAINKLIEGTLIKLLEKFYVIHQTGGAKEYNDYSRLENIRQELPQGLKDRYKLFKFIDPENISEIMNSADLVVSRSGVNTVAELMHLEKPCLLIPLPHGQVSEQLKNGKELEDIGLARVLKQEELTPEILYSQITQFIAKLDSSRFYQDKVGIKTPKHEKNSINYDAAEKIFQIIIEIHKQKK